MGRSNRGRCLSRTLLSSQLGRLRASVGNFSSLSVLLHFLDFDTSWLHGNFDDASLDRRLVGLSHQAPVGSSHPNVFSDDGAIHSNFVRNQIPIYMGAMGRR